MSLLSKITGRQHHYFVRFRYYPEQGNGSLYADRRLVIWTPDQVEITNQRGLKKACWSIDNIPRHLRKNGTLLIEQIDYLGWFKPKKVSK
ncbi:hypothetical protein ABIE60_000849 [Marinobacterium sp. MBR-109]